MNKSFKREPPLYHTGTHLLKILPKFTLLWYGLRSYELWGIYGNSCKRDAIAPMAKRPPRKYRKETHRRGQNHPLVDCQVPPQRLPLAIFFHVKLFYGAGVFGGVFFWIERSNNSFAHRRYFGHISSNCLVVFGVELVAVDQQVCSSAEPCS